MLYSGVSGLRADEMWFYILVLVLFVVLVVLVVQVSSILSHCVLPNSYALCLAA